MFEDKTFAALMDKARTYMPPDEDTSEGTVMYDCASPVCMLLAEGYADLTLLVKQVTMVTATGHYLDDHAAPYNVIREGAKPYIYEFIRNYSGKESLVGQRFFAEDNYYSIVEINGELYVQCDTPGTGVARLAEGTAIVPVYNIMGLSLAKVGAVYQYPTDEPNDDEFREELQDAVADPAENANTSQVRKWAKDFKCDYGGIKNAMVYKTSIYDEEHNKIIGSMPNNVTVFLNVDNMENEAEIVSAFQEYIDPVREGHGEGKGIIGTVYAVYPLKTAGISISCTIYKSGTVDDERLKNDIQNVVNEYFSKLVDERPNSETYLYLYRTNLQAVIETVDGVAQCEDMSINGNQKNIKLYARMRPMILSPDDITVNSLSEGGNEDDFDIYQG